MSTKKVKKIQLLKDIISKISEIRPHIVNESNGSDESGDKTLFAKLGQVMGIQNIMKLTFENLMGSSLKKFYAGRDLEYLLRRYTVFICSQITDEVIWQDQELCEYHA